MWVWGFGNHKWYKSLKSRVKDEWLDKTFVSRVISKTPYSHFRTHSISIVEKYKQAKRNYKWEEISFSKLNVLIYDSKSQCSHMWVHWLLLDSLVFTSILWSMYSHVPSKSQCTHMWLHWLKNCAITFNLHDKLFYSFSIVFNNVICTYGK